MRYLSLHRVAQPWTNYYKAFLVLCTSTSIALSSDALRLWLHSSVYVYASLAGPLLQWDLVILSALFNNECLAWGIYDIRNGVHLSLRRRVPVNWGHAGMIFRYHRIAHRNHHHQWNARSHLGDEAGFCSGILLSYSRLLRAFSRVSSSWSVVGVLKVVRWKTSWRFFVPKTNHS